MHITVFGAAGAVGRRVVTEALSRGHRVTAVSRSLDRLRDLPAEVEVRTGDATDPDQVAELSTGRDLVISATRPAPGREYELAVVAEGLLSGLARTEVRLLVVGGAGTLTVPGADGRTVAELPDFPADLLPIALACRAQLELFRTVADGGPVDWAYVSPPPLLEPGRRRGVYRVGTDELLVDDEGASFLSMEDLAVALLDEAERPKHHRTRFTVGY
ncbi:NAD(P)-dependent oxidoreductase [Nocardia transvalensis]|uniref:NAD(P)-dependent oxidoreductase n=1 Tax=Nocardia transvalensis TaxID=37333 RepID=UPI0018957AAE|nr:NAD(P)H-binding protein [Nocardia transvalensis]MBF6328597.1 NAD(P)H-binding protein [Nocardia transvalensis]